MRRVLEWDENAPLEQVQQLPLPSSEIHELACHHTRYRLSRCWDLLAPAQVAALDRRAGANRHVSAQWAVWLQLRCRKYHDEGIGEVRWAGRD